MEMNSFSAAARRLPVLSAAVVHRSLPRLLVLTACSLTLLWVAQARGAVGHSDSQTGQSGTAGTAPSPSATLDQCVTAVAQSERSATFAGEMTAIPGTAHMAMRISVEERLPGEALFHTVSAPALGAWRAADPKVKVYKYLKQVTNLSSPALYRALVRFRWLNARGHLIRRAERLTPACLQPASPRPVAPPTTEAPSPTSTSTSPTVAG
jgi:hypothetical protein